jgi:peroxiredoxin
MKLCMKPVLIILICISTSGGWAQSNTKVTGELKGLKAGTVIYLWPLNDPAKKDSVVAGKGRFAFNLALEEGDYYWLKIGNAAAFSNNSSLYLQPGMVKIKGKDSLLLNAELSGSRFAVEQNDLKKYIAKGRKEFEPDVTRFFEAYNKKDSITTKALLPKQREWYKAEKELYRQWVLDHPSSPVSAMVLWLYIREKNSEELEKMLNHLRPEAKQNVLVKQMQQSIEIARTTAIGKPAPDFVQNDTSGNPVALKDLRGRYVLIDFWASWCVPCRKENPNVVRVYNNFKDKNFTVLGVSLDQPNGKEKWLKAIKDDQLTWTHVSDLKFWDNAVAKLYGIKSVPANLLIGPDGVILAKDLRGEMLEETLRKYIK